MKIVSQTYSFHGMRMLKRHSYDQQLEKLFAIHPIVAILGPRQCGKTTLARAYLGQSQQNNPANYFDLESSEDLSRLTDNPQLNLSHLKGIITIDEIQRKPELFPTLRVLVDKPDCQQKFLILGSASRELLQQSSETLAGRIAYLELTPFSFPETNELSTLWQRGGFPRAYLAASDELSYLWRQNYIRTFLEQDIPNLGINITATNLRRFWMMLTDYHGNILNASELGRSLNLSHNTIRHYVDILQGTFMIRQLQPWFENIKKRQVKSPKIYFRDSGILHSLLGIKDHTELLTHPRLGASWEGFALEAVIRQQQVDPEDCFFWAVHQQMELDLLTVKNNRKIGYEFKYSLSPKLTKSMESSYELLQLEKLIVIYPGMVNFQLAENIEAVSLEKFLRED